MKDFTSNDLLDLQIRYKDDSTVLDLIEIVRSFTISEFTPVLKDE